MAQSRSFLLLGWISLITMGVGVQAGEPASAHYRRESLEPQVARIIDEFRSTVPRLLRQHKVAGAAVALVDQHGIMWAEGFGSTDTRGKIPVTPHTLFSIGGISKVITATAVLRAVQDGLVKLDASITNYLPDFNMNSRHQDQPEREITLRRLINHTAGIPVEAPLGNYFEPAPSISFEQHVKSLYGNWLVYPVGQAFQSSNASADLAAYALQVVAGKSYEQYLQEKVFTPLGMVRSMADRSQILNARDRAVGHMLGIDKMPTVLPSLGGSGIFSTAHDLARFLHMLLNNGTIEGKPFLDAALAESIPKPVSIVQAPHLLYGLGLFIDKRAPERVHPILWHDGWGLGFSGLMHWYPEYQIGVVALSNRLPNSGINELGLSLTDKLIKQKLVPRLHPPHHPQTNQCVGAWWGWADHKPTPYQPSWRKYTGTYRLSFSAYELEWWAKLAVFVKGRDEYTPRISVQPKEGYLCLTESKFFELAGDPRHINQRLQEIKPGLFTAASGIILDLTGNAPTWRNYQMEKR